MFSRPIFSVLLFFPLLLSGQTLNLSRDLVVKGIASSNMAPDSPALDSRPLLEAAVIYAGQNGIQTLIADPGAYYFLTLRNISTHVLLNAAANLTIDWQDSDLLFRSSNVAAVQCTNCSGVTMQNFTLDYQQLPFTQVTVTSVDAERADVQLLDQSRLSVTCRFQYQPRCRCERCDLDVHLPQWRSDSASGEARCKTPGLPEVPSRSAMGTTPGPARRNSLLFRRGTRWSLPIAAALPPSTS